MNKQSEKLKVKGEKYKICATDFEGITLVALVITIIVLIILAGVSINAVMNQGLITNAKDASKQYEKSKTKEETAITDMEVITDFKTSGKSIKYKFKNGYLTGITLDENRQAETVESVESKLPDGYEIYNVDGSAIQNKTIIVTNGMIVKKENQTLGRVIIFGDVNCDGKIDTSEGTAIANVYNSKKNEEQQGYKEYQIVAMDVNHDKMLNPDDANMVGKYMSGAITELPQDYYACSYDELDIPYYEDNSISEEFKTKYNWHYEMSDDYEGEVINVPSGTTVGEVLRDLESEYKTIFNLYNEETSEREAIADTTSTALVTNSSTIEIKYHKSYTKSFLVIVE